MIFYGLLFAIIPIAIIFSIAIPSFHRFTNEKYLQPTEKSEEVIKEDS